MRKLKVIGLAAACLLSAGCASTEAQPSVQVNVGARVSPMSPNTLMFAPTMPPHRWRQPIPMAPGPGMVWVDGNWAWNGGAWVWVPGTWARPPFPRAKWRPGHWNRNWRRGGSRWVGGRWR
jgi:hypothetical protein